MSRNWRQEMLNTLKTPLTYKSGYIADANGNEVAKMYRENNAWLTPVHRDELAKELVKRFNEYKEDNMKNINLSVSKKEFTTILAGLRYLQANHDDAVEAMSDFDDAEGTQKKPYLLKPEEIDKFCEKINIGG